MVKVFIVEDEDIIRESIIKNIPWEKEGLLLSGDAGDGEIALSSIKETKPDILITDVKMPFMTGLELARLVKKEHPEIKIIVLSGYREFEYATEAINIGVTEFLSKPITSTKLLEVIKKVKDEIERDKRIKTNDDEKKNRRDIEKKLFFDRLLTQSDPIPELISQSIKLNIDIISPCYLVMLCKPIIKPDENESFSTAIKAVDIITNLLSMEDNLVVFNRGFDGLAILIKGKNELEIEEMTKSLKSKIATVLSSFSSIDYFGAVGSVESRLSQIYLSYQNANKAFSSRFFSSVNQIIDYKALAESLDKKSLENPEAFNWKILESFFMSARAEDVPNFTRKYIEDFKLSDITYKMKNHIIMNAYLCAHAWLDSQNLNNKEIGKLPDEFESSKDLFSMLEKIFSSVMAEKNNLRPISSQIRKAQAFIQNNIGESKINLNSVADYVCMSPNYFSTLFSQETGQTFIDYLTRLRINKACQLLTTTNQKPIDIAMEIGYQDSHYFCTLFKKLTGYTPKEYRNKINKYEI